jgi:hypothetical protein
MCDAVVEARFNPNFEDTTGRRCLAASFRIRVDCLFIALGSTAPAKLFREGRRKGGKSVVQIRYRQGVDITSVAAIANLIAINAAAKRWPGIVRLRDSKKFLLEGCGPPGFGRSDAIPISWRVEECVELVVDTIGLERASVGGVSTERAFALGFTFQVPEGVRATRTGR